MSIATYDDLVVAVGNWLQRDDLAARVPEFIALAEAKFNRSLRCVQMEKRSYANVDSGASEPQYISLPNDFQAMRSVCLTGVTGKPRLQYLSDTQIKDLRANIGDATGEPSYFGIFGTEMELVATPDDDYELEMIYRATVPGLSTVNQSNWLLIMSPDAYLYGTLLEATVLIKDDPRIDLWVKGLASAIEGINTLTKDMVA
jgi:hypothetical protein